MSGRKGGIVTIRNFQYLCACIFFASLNFEMFCPFVEKFSVTKMAGYLYLGSLLLTPRNIFSINGIGAPVLSTYIMFALMVFSSIIHSNINTVVFDTTIFMNIVIFLLMLNHQRKDNRVLHEGLIWYAFSCSVLGILFLNGIGLTYDVGGRIRIFGDNSNVTGIKMAVGILWLLDYCLNHSIEKKIYKPWLLVLTLPMFALLFATASRTALLILSAGSILFILYRDSKQKNMRFLWLFLGLVFLAIGYSIVSNQEVLVGRMSETIDEGSISGRDEIWKKYFVLIQQHPLLGVGFTGHYQYAYDTLGQAMSPHNVLIEVALYSGIFGLIFFLILLTHIFKNAWKYKKYKQNLAPLITSMAIVAMVLSGQALGIKLFWTLAALCLSQRFENVNTKQVR